MTDWEIEPCSIEKLENVDCIFSIDENGTSCLKNAHLFTDNNKMFTVTGVHIKVNDFSLIKDQVTELKSKYWQDGLFRNKRVVLHSKDIRKKQGPFNPKLIDSDEFNNDLNELLSSLPVKIYSATINKLEHCNKYCDPFPVYELGVEFIIERFCFELRRKNKKGIILLESRGYYQDCLVLEKIKKLMKIGNDFNDEENFTGIIGVYFNPKRTKDELKSYFMLELSDLFSYRIHKYIKTDEMDENFDYIKEKIFGYPNFEGKGIKRFP